MKKLRNKLPYSFYPLMLGILLAFCLAPHDFSFLGFISFSCLLLILHKIPHERKFGQKIFQTGFYFALGYFTTGLRWLANAVIILMTHYYDNSQLIISNLTPLLAYLLVFLFCSTLSCYWAIAIYLSQRWQQPLWLRCFTLSFSLTIAEYLRSHLFTGFAWNLIGYCAAPVPILMQIVSKISIYGLTFGAIFIYSSLALLLSKNKQKMAKFTLVLALAIFLTTLYYGKQKLQNHPLATTSGGTEPTILIVQPNISQSDKLDETKSADNFMKLIDLSAKYNKENTDLIIWPETAINFILNNDSYAMENIKSLLYKNQKLLLGAPRIAKQNGEIKIYNSALLINASGKILDYSDKVHLVPFGEYVPFSYYLTELFPKYKSFFQGYSFGEKKHSVKLANNIYYLPLICYEDSFSDELKYGGRKANLIISLSNDAWYGNSDESYQHLRQAQFRAIEQGVALIRVSNNGVSATIDNYGRITKELELNKEGIISITISSLKLY